MSLILKKKVKKRKSPGITTVIRTDHLGTLNVCSKVHQADVEILHRISGHFLSTCSGVIGKVRGTSLDQRVHPLNILY